jgi:hypothetical protein
MLYQLSYSRIRISQLPAKSPKATELLPYPQQSHR